MGEYWEKRVANIFEVDYTDEALEEELPGLPQVSNEALEQYQRYLKQKLTFPFEATFDHFTGIRL